MASTRGPCPPDTVRPCGRSPWIPVEPVVEVTIHHDGARPTATPSSDRRERRSTSTPTRSRSMPSSALDPALVSLVERTPGIRIPGAVDPFELLLRAVFGQQVSVAGARTQLGAFVQWFGTPLDEPVGSITHAFPTPERVAAIAPEELGMPRRRADTIRRLGELVASDAVDLSDQGNDARGDRRRAGHRSLDPRLRRDAWLPRSRRVPRDRPRRPARVRGARAAVDDEGHPRASRALASVPRIRRDAPLERAPCRRATA